MAVQGQAPTDVLCLHHRVTVPRELSDEGLYSVLLFFDTASVVLEDSRDEGTSTRGGQSTRSVPLEDERGEEGDEDSRRKQQCCHDLSKAMSILLTGEGGDDEGPRSYSEDANMLNGTYLDGGHSLGNGHENVGASQSIGECNGGSGARLAGASRASKPRRTTSVGSSLKEQPKEVFASGGGDDFNSTGAHGRVRPPAKVEDPPLVTVDGTMLKTEGWSTGLEERSLQRRQRSGGKLGNTLACTTIVQHNSAAEEIMVEYSSSYESSSTEPRDDLVMSPEPEIVMSGEDTPGRSLPDVHNDDPTHHEDSMLRSQDFRDRHGCGRGHGGSDGDGSDDCDEVKGYGQYEDDFFSEEDEDALMYTHDTTYVFGGGEVCKQPPTRGKLLSPSHKQHSCAAAPCPRLNEVFQESGEWTSATPDRPQPLCGAREGSRLTVNDTLGNIIPTAGEIDDKIFAPYCGKESIPPLEATGNKRENVNQVKRRSIGDDAGARTGEKYDIDSGHCPGVVCGRNVGPTIFKIHDAVEEDSDEGPASGGEPGCLPRNSTAMSNSSPEPEDLEEISDRAVAGDLLPSLEPTSIQDRPYSSNESGGVLAWRPLLCSRIKKILGIWARSSLRSANGK